MKTKLKKFRLAILRDFPSLVAAKFKLIGAGWDSAAVDVDRKLIFKFPRKKAARESSNARRPSSQSCGRRFRSPYPICVCTKGRRSSPAI